MIDFRLRKCFLLTRSHFLHFISKKIVPEIFISEIVGKMSSDINVANSSKLVKHNVGNSLQVRSLVINCNMSRKNYFRGNLQKIVKRWGLLKLLSDVAVKKSSSEIPGCLNFAETEMVFCYQNCSDLL